MKIEEYRASFWTERSVDEKSCNGWY